MGRMHKPTDEKRSVVILRPEDYDEWLHTRNVEAARAMMQLLPADDMQAEPVTDK
jgi:putative SOS response-associated peptidase YedK